MGVGTMRWLAGVLLLLVSALVVEAQPVTRGLTGCWKFDDASGDMAQDCTAGNSDFQFVAAPPWGTGGQCYLNGCVRNTGSISGQYAGMSVNFLAFGSASTLSL